MNCWVTSCWAMNCWATHAARRAMLAQREQGRHGYFNASHMSESYVFLTGLWWRSQSQLWFLGYPTHSLHLYCYFIFLLFVDFSLYFFQNFSGILSRQNMLETWNWHQTWTELLSHSCSSENSLERHVGYFTPSQSQCQSHCSTMESHSFHCFHFSLVTVAVSAGWFDETDVKVSKHVTGLSHCVGAGVWWSRHGGSVSLPWELEFYNHESL